MAMTNSVTASIGILLVFVGSFNIRAADPDKKEVVFEERPLRIWLEESLDIKSIEARDKADYALHRFCADAKVATPALTAALADKNEDVRRAAAYFLGYGCKSAAVSALPTLLKTLRSDQSANVRGAAAVAVGVISPEDEVVLTTLLEAVKEDKAPHVRKTIIREFRYIKPTTVIP